MIAITLSWRVVLGRSRDGIDLPELTLIYLGVGVMHFQCIPDYWANGNKLIMESTCDEPESWLDLPKLSTLVIKEDTHEDDPIPPAFSFVRFSRLKSTCFSAP